MSQLANLAHSLGNLLPALLVFGALVIVHEWGHFIACRLSKIRVEKFSIGFGPELFHWQAKETRFSISILPLGGFVSPAGEEASKIGPEGPRPGDYLAASVGARTFVVISGVVMNYLLAFVIFWFIFLIGRPVPGTVVGDFVKGYPAESSELKIGDKILRVDDQAVANWKDILDAFDKAPGEAIKLEVERTRGNGPKETLAVSIIPKIEDVKDVFGKSARLKRLGITPDPTVFIYEKYSLVPAFQKAWETEVFHTVLTHKAIFYLITGQLSPKNLMGPLGIIQLSGQAAKAGFATLLQLLAILSISLAVINLLPFPALDGGHLIFLICEAITRRRLSPILQERIVNGGFVLLMALMVFVLYNDFVNLELLSKIKNILHLTK